MVEKDYEQIQKISVSEWEVVRVLWQRGESTATEVWETLAETCDWSPKTVRTFLTRLVQKEAVRVEMSGGVNYYTARVEETTSKQVLGLSFLNKFFSGALSSMVAHFVNNGRVSLEELAALEKVIEERRRQLKKPPSHQRHKKMSLTDDGSRERSAAQ